MEYLLGRSLKTNLHNLGLAEKYAAVLKGMGRDLEDLYECEPDAGLGNGGLGRLAACFTDSLASLGYPACGFSICYEFGLFRQKIIDGLQVELPDNWLPGGDVWLLPRPDRVFTVRMGGRVRENWNNGRCEIAYEDTEDVEALPYDMMISGGDSETVARLRLWKSRPVGNFNMNLFSQGRYAKAMEESASAEIISKVLYPSDNHTEGKLLRLTQQYFLTSASVQNIIRDHMAVYHRIDNLADKAAIHINDTHPALVIPELMRILLEHHRRGQKISALADLCRRDPRIHQLLPRRHGEKRREGQVLRLPIQRILFLCQFDLRLLREFDGSARQKDQRRAFRQS